MSGPENGHIRKLGRSERDVLCAHLLRLTPEERRMRFLGSVGDASIRRYCERPRPFHTVVLGYFADGILRGAGELLLDEQVLWTKRAEVALTVEGPFQGRGVGAELLRRLVVLARNRGVAVVHMTCLAENERVQAIARGLDAVLEIEEGGVEGRVHPPWPTHLSLLEEAMSDSLTLMRVVLGVGRTGDTPAPDAAPRSA